MIKRNYNIRLDLHNEVNNPSMKFNILDEETSTFNVRITRSGEKVSLENEKATVYISTPKGQTFNIPGEIIQGKYVFVKLPNDKLQEVGNYTGQLSFVNGNKRLVTNEFNFEVIECPL